MFFSVDNNDDDDPLLDEYYCKEEIGADFIWEICDKMMLIGIII